MGRPAIPRGALRAAIPNPDLLVALAYLLIALAVTWPVAADFGGSMLGGKGWRGHLPGGDECCFLWAFWWFREAQLGLKTDLFHTPMLAHPGGLSLLSTPITPLYAAISVPLQSFLSLVTIYNVFVIFSLWSTAFFTYLFARAIKRRGDGATLSEPRTESATAMASATARLAVSRPAAFLCGCVFGFTTFHAAHWTHLNLLCAQWIPMTLWAAWRGLETRRARWAVLAGLGVTFEAYSEWYLLVFLGILLFAAGVARAVAALRGQQARDERRVRPWFWAAVAACALATNVFIQVSLAIPCLFVLYGAFVLAMLIHSHPYRRVHLRNLIVFCAVAGALVAPLQFRLLSESRRERTVERAPLMAKIMLSAEPWNYVLPQAALRAIDERIAQRPIPQLHASVGGEYDIFPGYAVWALCLFVAWRRRWRARDKYWLAIASVFAVLSWGVGLKSFGRMVPIATCFDTFLLPGVSFDLLPLVTGLRVFARFGLMVQFVLAAWLAANLDDCGLRKSAIRNPQFSWLLAVVLSLAVLVERFHGPQDVCAVRDASSFRELDRILPQNAVILGLPLEAAPAMMYCQTRHHRRLINFFGARVPALTLARFEGTLLYHLLSRPQEAQSGTLGVPLTDETAARVTAELDGLGGTFILLHRPLCAPGDEAALCFLCADFLHWRTLRETPEYVLYGARQ